MRLLLFAFALLGGGPLGGRLRRITAPRAARKGPLASTESAESSRATQAGAAQAGAAGGTAKALRNLRPLSPRSVRSVLDLCESSVEAAAQRARGSVESELFVGLDISKTATGYAALWRNGSVAEWGAFVPPAKSKLDVLGAGAFFEDEMEGLRRRLGDVRYSIACEDFLRAFSGGASSQSTIFTIGQINGIVRFLARKVFAPPNGVRAFHVTAIRSFFQIDLRGHRKTAKQTVLKHTLAHLRPTAAEPCAAQDDLDRFHAAPPENVTAAVSAAAARAFGARLPVASSVYDASDAFLVAKYAMHAEWLERLQEDETLRGRFEERYVECFGGRMKDGMPPAGTEAAAKLQENYEKALQDWLKERCAIEDAHAGNSI